MRRTVVLRHDVPNGSFHFDWLIAMRAAEGAELRAFRLDTPAHRLPPGKIIAAEQLPDHRAAYLRYEGPVSGDRGHVRRVASGWADVRCERPNLLEIVVRWDVARAGCDRGRRADRAASAGWDAVQGGLQGNDPVHLRCERASEDSLLWRVVALETDAQ
ncbi:MAG: hypothetical protein KAS72_10330 [Phycisphaerales bacterium]|nr:hypothetical protein [Phycisphaerales bacterium]